MIAPVAATSFTEAMQVATETFHTLKGIIKKKYGQDAVNAGDEGGFAPPILDAFDGLNLLVEAIEKAGYTGRVKIAMDVAASEFATKNEETGEFSYDLKKKVQPNDGSGVKSVPEMQALYKDMAHQYPVVSIEDPFDQDDWSAYAGLTSSIGGPIQIVGDDLLVTNPVRVSKAIQNKACNVSRLFDHSIDPE
jgi:enolase